MALSTTGVLRNFTAEDFADFVAPEVRTVSPQVGVATSTLPASRPQVVVEPEPEVDPMPQEPDKGGNASQTGTDNASDTGTEHGQGHGGGQAKTPPAKKATAKKTTAKKTARKRTTRKRS
jgi:hypothetical protein